jgi:PAS domain S-box-containing protein
MQSHSFEEQYWLFVALDQKEIAAFDRLARLAARLLQAPIALITLAAIDQQRIIGQHGLSEPWASQRSLLESHRFFSQIMHAGDIWVADISSDAPIVVPPELLETPIRAYISIPLRTDSQRAIGLLTIFDQRPHQWSAADRENLADLAESVLTDMHLRQALLAMQRAEQALQYSDTLFRNLAAHVDSILWLSDPTNSRVLYISPAYQRITGYEPGRLFDYSHSIVDIVHPDDRERVEREMDRQSHESFDTEFRIIRADGEIIWLRDQNFLIHDHKGQVLQVAGIATDITRQRRAEDALRESAEQYRHLFERNPQPMWVFDRETLEFLAVNNAAVHHYGYSHDEFRSMTLKDIRPPEEIPALLHATQQAKQGFRTSQRLWRHRKKDGTLIEVETTHHSIVFDGRQSWLTLIQDVTERNLIQTQLIQAQKIESLGQLAGGIAHDVNNTLMVISGCIDLIAANLESDHPAQEEVAAIDHAVQRASDLARQLLTFARQQESLLRKTDLNELIRMSARMLRRVISNQSVFELELDTALPPVMIDPSQFEQVLLNLVVNARDAMPDGGRLSITTKAPLPRGGNPSGEPEEGPFATVLVSDTGIGIPPEVQKRIFEPFFTTKEAGKGTGLGLAVCYGIVRQSGGSIEVESRLHQGTTFTIRLPALLYLTTPVK